MSSHPGLPPHETAPSAEGRGKVYIDREIPLELIDEPSLPERETMEPEALANLAMDIMAIGLTNPLTVFERSGRYEVIAGHRRLLACRLAELQMVPCRIRQGANVDPVAILVSENEEREKVNPIHQARFYERLLIERCDNDVDKLCVLVKRKRDHVESRLLILLGHPGVVAAIEAGKIRLSVASELNKIPDKARLELLLDVAINSGATARQVAQWAKEGAALGEVFVPPDGAPGDAQIPPPSYSSNPMECFYCEGTDYPHMMEMLWLHGPCKKILERILQRSPAPSPGSEG